jgi:hypothetical protein
MKTTLKVVSYFAIFLGAMAIIGSLEGGPDALYEFLGGSLFLTQGILSLLYIKRIDKIFVGMGEPRPENWQPKI